MSLCKLAELTGISYSRRRKILIYNDPISIKEALLLAEVFHTDPDFWINIYKIFIMTGTKNVTDNKICR